VISAWAISLWESKQLSYFEGMKRYFWSAVFVLILATYIIGILIPGARRIAETDAVSYWAAAQLLIHHQNPYDQQAVLQLEHSVGFRASVPLVMRNPPYALFLTLPFAFLSPSVFGMLWAIASVLCILISVRLLWAYVRNDGPVPPVVYAFAPFLACVIIGQSSAFMLLGVSLFLRWHQNRPFLAGMSLVLAAIKPHILLPFFIVVLCWMIVHRTCRLFAGTAIGFLTALSIALYFKHSIVADYLPELQRGNVVFTTCIGSGMRYLLNRNVVWLQFIPCALACSWAIWYFFHSEWEWNRQGLLVLIISLWAAPYSWPFDEVIAFPAVLYFIAQRTSLRTFYVLNFAAVAMLVSGIRADAIAYLWTSTAWLGWYLLSIRSTQSRRAQSPFWAAIVKNVRRHHATL